MLGLVVGLFMGFVFGVGVCFYIMDNDYDRAKRGR